MRIAVILALLTAGIAQQDGKSQSEVLQKEAIQKNIERLSNEFEATDAVLELTEIGPPAIYPLMTELKKQRDLENSDNPNVREDSYRVRLLIVQILSSIRSNAQSVVDELKIELKASGARRYGIPLPSFAARALGRTGVQDAAPALLEAMKDSKDKELKYEVLAAVGNLRVHSPEVVDSLRECLESKDKAYAFGEGTGKSLRAQALEVVRRVKAVELKDKIITLNLLSDGETESDSGMQISWFAARALEALAGEYMGPLGPPRLVDTSRINSTVDAWRKWAEEQKKEADKKEKANEFQKKYDKVKEKLNKVVNAVNEFKTKKSKLPQTLEELRNEKILEEAMTDEWGSPLKYVVTGDTFEVYSQGSDKNDGRTGEARDIHVAATYLQNAKTKTNDILKKVGTAVFTFKNTHGVFPANLNELAVKPAKLQNPDKWAKLLDDANPKDGFNNPLVYNCIAEGKAFDLVSYGYDGEEAYSDGLKLEEDKDTWVWEIGDAAIVQGADWAPLRKSETEGILKKVMEAIEQQYKTSKLLPAGLISVKGYERALDGYSHKITYTMPGKDGKPYDLVSPGANLDSADDDVSLWSLKLDKFPESFKEETKKTLDKVAHGVEDYNKDAKSYPASIQDLLKMPANASRMWRKYLDKFPRDAWGNEVQYQKVEGRRKFRVYSFGADGKEGGENDAADIEHGK